MLTKTIVVLLLIGIFASLGSALFFMMRSKEPNKRTVKALTFRIGLSIGLFILLFIGYGFGWIEPHGLAG